MKTGMNRTQYKPSLLNKIRTWNYSSTHGALGNGHISIQYVLKIATYGQKLMAGCTHTPKKLGWKNGCWHSAISQFFEMFVFNCRLFTLICFNHKLHSLPTLIVKIFAGMGVQTHNLYMVQQVHTAKIMHLAQPTPKIWLIVITYDKI